jgi:hypothetical protein
VSSTPLRVGDALPYGVSNLLSSNVSLVDGDSFLCRVLHRDDALVSMPALAQ